jgi:hypothetical protein
MVSLGLGTFFVRRAGRPDASEQVGQRVGWSKNERQLGLLDEGSELVGVAGQGLVSELKAEDDKAGGRGFEPAADDSRDHLCEGALDGDAVYEGGQVEGRQPWLSPGCTRGTAGGVVVEAELLAAEGGRAAAVAGGVEVMAGWMGCGHGGLLWIAKSESRLKAKGPAVSWAFSISY